MGFDFVSYDVIRRKLKGDEHMSTDSGSSIADNVGDEQEVIQLSPDAELQKKSVKSVVFHLKKKVDPGAAGIDRVCVWLADMDALLAQDGFNRGEYLEMRKKLNDAIEWVFDVELRHKLRNSWYSFGKAMDKKVPKH